MATTYTPRYRHTFYFIFTFHQRMNYQNTIVYVSNQHSKGAVFSYKIVLAYTLRLSVHVTYLLLTEF